MVKSDWLWDSLDILGLLILILSLSVIFLGHSNCPDRINTNTAYGMFISAACKFGIRGVIWIILAILSFLAIVFFTSRIMRKSK